VIDQGNMASRSDQAGARRREARAIRPWGRAQTRAKAAARPAHRIFAPLKRNGRSTGVDNSACKLRPFRALKALGRRVLLSSQS
jgi:hypothetical protein